MNITNIAALIEGAIEYMEDYEDVADGCEGPKPNKAMMATNNLKEVLRELSKNNAMVQKRIKELERLHFQAIMAFQEYDNKLFAWPSKLKKLNEDITNYHARKRELERWVEKM